MSQKELSRLELIQRIKERRLKVSHAAQLAGVSRRQVHRWIRSYDVDGAEGLASKKRGKPSNRKYSEALRANVISLVTERYYDFGPTLAREKLDEIHNIRVSKETLRKWMIESGIWTPRVQSKKRIYQPRYRRDCYGELIQIDGSDHEWFEGRAARCTLLVYIDDATSKLMHLEFVHSESTFDYMRATSAYISKHGKPLAFYSDKHSVFRINVNGALSGDNMTQFSRSLKELNIDIICANSPQAKGRVERANSTLQDRLVKELRLRGISSMEEANKFMPEYIEMYNAKFAREPRLAKDIHRSLTEHEDMDLAFCVKNTRTLAKDLSLQYDLMRFLVEPNDQTAKLVGKEVTVHDYPDGRVEIRHLGKPLSYRIFDKVRYVDQGAITDNKRLGSVLSRIAENQRETVKKRTRRCRKGQKNTIFR